MMCIYVYSVQLLSKHYTTGEIEYTTSRTPRRRDGQYNIIMQSSAGADLSTYIIIIIICLFSYNTHTIFFHPSSLYLQQCARDPSSRRFYLMKYKYNIRRAPRVPYRYHSYLLYLPNIIVLNPSKYASQTGTENPPLYDYDGDARSYRT